MNVMCNCASGRGAEHCVVHAGNHVLPALDADPRDAYSMQAYDSQDMGERMANADYEHGQAMFNPDGTIG